jgi:adhesin transport system outer membrane protein
VQSSKKVLESYQSQFVAGRKSWQDVLNAVRELSVSQYAEKEARIGVAGAMRRIQARAGLLEQTHEQ